ncbi:hypothetical protein BpHYR1_045952 [Brachionus plicatilis]|uniref:Uncharacterized protein n=1 Tax=Brachionus plicatilis TaxID=10195 RepID=A0A3M7T6Y8_BRAPC|nr:hypothetical protein BpHYR1_045952 [Brachionus plicatilis]
MFRPKAFTIDAEVVKLGSEINAQTRSNSFFYQYFKATSEASRQDQSIHRWRLNESSFRIKAIELSIKSALNCRNVICAMGKLKLSIDTWQGEQDVIFTDITEKILYISVTDIPQATQTNGKVVLNEDLVIKERCEQLVKAKVEKLTTGKQVIFSPNITDFGVAEGILWPRSVNDVKEEQSIFVSVINLGDEEVTVGKDTEIAECDAADLLQQNEKAQSKLLKEGKINWDIKYKQFTKT